MENALSPDAIAAAIDRRREFLVDTIQQLVRIPSVTGQEGPAQEAVARLMSQLQLAVDQWTPDPAELAPFAEHVGEFDSLDGRPNVVGVWKGSASGRSIILNAHIDTVEPGDPERWSHPPFSGKLVGSSIVGRGACDMKAGLATNLTAIAALQDLRYQPAGDIIVESVISEENGGAGALASRLRGYRADGAIISEPTNLALVIAQGGSLVFRVKVEGKSAHAAVRDEGESAFEHFLPVWTALRALEERRNAEIDHPLYREIANKIPINIGVVQSGSWHSSVPEWLIAEGRAGLVPGEELATFKAEVESTIQRAARNDDWLRRHPPVVEWFSGQFVPAEIPPGDPLVEVTSLAHLDITGRAAPLAAATYGSDMRHFILFGETPCLMYGAGDVTLAHHTDESISIDDALTASKTIALLVNRWCSDDNQNRPP